MKANNFTTSKKVLGGILIFTMGGASGYFLKSNILTDSEANSTYYMVCHQEDGKKPRTMVVTGSSLQAHLNHGDHLGSCVTATFPDDTKTR